MPALFVACEANCLLHVVTIYRYIVFMTPMLKSDLESLNKAV